MDNVKELLSRYKSSLDNFICDYKNKVASIEEEENYIKLLGDVVSSCESDILLLPFYDEEVLSDVFKHVFSLSTSEFSKIKTAKYLIEASKNVDRDSFLQYKNAVKDVEKIYDRLKKNYKKLSKDDKLVLDKKNYLSKIDEYSSISLIIGDDSFSKLIDNVVLFKETLYLCDFNVDEIDLILSTAIKSNLVFLDSGVVSLSGKDESTSMKEQSDIIQNKISDLSNLLENS